MSRLIWRGPDCAPQVIDEQERRRSAGDARDSGAGGLGLNAIAVAKERGVARIIVIDGIKSRLELAHEFGADETIDLREFPTPESRVKRVRELTEGFGADYVMELAGHASVVPEGIEMLANGGMYLKYNINQKQRKSPHHWFTAARHSGLMWYRPACTCNEISALLTYPFTVLSHRFLMPGIGKPSATRTQAMCNAPALAVGRIIKKTNKGMQEARN
jgi:hypothetical protein